MSRNLFEEGVFEREKKEDTYSAGDESLTLLTGKLIDLYHSLPFPHGTSNFEDTYRPVLQQFEAAIPHDVPGQETLDAFIDTLGVTLPQDKVHFTAGAITALVQALYNRGHNDFDIDFEKYRKSEKGYAYPGFFCWFLEGEEHKPLKLTYTGDVGQFAGDTKFCDFTFIGDTTVLGKYAEDCSFTAHGYAHQLGYACKRSTFREHGRSDRVGLECEDSRFYLKDYPRWEMEYEQKRFFMKNNELWLLDESGMDYVRELRHTP